MPLKQFKGFLVIVTIASLGVGVVGLGLTQIGRRTYDPIKSAQLIPDTALMAAFISRDPQAFNQLQQFGNTEIRQLITRNLNPIKQNSLDSSQLNFDQDVEPWMSGIMVALLPSSADLDLLMVVGIKDPLRAWMFRRQFHRQPGLQQIEHEYNQIKITEYIESAGKRYHVALLNQYVVVAASRQPVEQAIDTMLGQPALADQPGIVQTFLNSANLSHPLGTVWISESQTVLAQLLSASTPDVEEFLRIFSQLKPLKSAVIAVGVEPDGVRIKIVNPLDPETITPDSYPELSSIVSRFPSDTVALIQGKGIDQIWSRLLQLAEDNETVSQWVKQIRRGLQTINLDADQEVISWMDGEFALGAIASDEGILAPLGLGGVLLLETSDYITADRMLDQLDGIIAQSNPPVNIEKRWIKNIEVTEWRDPQQGALFGHGWLTDQLLFIAFGEPVVEVITALPQSSLPENPQFKTITESLPQANLSYIYLNIDQLISWATGYLLAAPATALQPNLLTLLNSIQGIGVSVIYSAQSTAEIEMLLVLEPVTNELHEW